MFVTASKEWEIRNLLFVCDLDNTRRLSIRYVFMQLIDSSFPLEAFINHYK